MVHDELVERYKEQCYAICRSDNGVMFLRGRREGRNIVHTAAAIAVGAHNGIGQRRNRSKKPYWVHLRESAQMVALFGLGPVYEAAAWLHDILEDTEWTEVQLREIFDNHITDAVVGLTNAPKPDCNRAARTILYATQAGEQCGAVQTVRIVESISNMISVVVDMPDFARQYLKEKLVLFDYCTKAHPVALAVAKQINAELTLQLDKKDG